MQGLEIRCRARRCAGNAARCLAPWLLLVGCLAANATTLFAQAIGVDSPRELVALHGIDASQLNRFQDGEPLGATDEEPLIRILQRFPRFPRDRLESWSQQPDDWRPLVESPDEHRTEVYRLAGLVTGVERVAIPPDLAQRLEFDAFYRVTMKPDDASYSLTVCTRHIPDAWKPGKSLSAPAGAIGLFLKSGALRDGVQEIVFAADRVAWYPDRVQPERGITASHVYLAGLGFDVGLLDAVRNENKKPLSLADRECFYSLLAAVRRADQTDFAAHARQPIDLVALLSRPQEHQGTLMSLRGIARRAIRVRVADEDVRKRFGIEHYFQIDLFVDLNRQVIKFGTGDDAEEMPVFENSFPVTVCVLSLPENLPEGELLRENIEVEAAFFKLWTYTSDYVTSFDKEMRQLSPMLIGTRPRVVDVPTINPGFGIVLATFVVISLIGIWIGLRWQGTRPPFPRGTPTGSGLSGPAGGGAEPLPERPDFSGLKEIPRSDGS